MQDGLDYGSLHRQSRADCTQPIPSFIEPAANYPLQSVYPLPYRKRICSVRSIVPLKQLFIAVSLQLLLRSPWVCVYICQKVNILGKAQSGEELQNVKYNLGCQMSSGKALDSCFCRNPSVRDFLLLPFRLNLCTPLGQNCCQSSVKGTHI